MQEYSGFVQKDAVAMLDRQPVRPWHRPRACMIFADGPTVREDEKVHVFSEHRSAKSAFEVTVDCCWCLDSNGIKELTIHICKWQFVQIFHRLPLSYCRHSECASKWQEARSREESSNARTDSELT